MTAPYTLFLLLFACLISAAPVPDSPNDPLHFNLESLASFRGKKHNQLVERDVINMIAVRKKGQLHTRRGAYDQTVKVCNRTPVVNYLPEGVRRLFAALKRLNPTSNGTSTERNDNVLTRRRFREVDEINVQEEDYLLEPASDNPPDEECPLGSKNYVYGVGSTANM